MAPTPGPWIVRWFEKVQRGETLHRCSINGARYVAEINDPGLVDEAKANARLIAAAPDLLAALDALVAACELTGERAVLTRRIVTERARAAIARARGA